MAFSIKESTIRWWKYALAALLIVGGLWYVFGGTKTAYQFVTVTKGTITQTVSVTGNTTPLKSVSLGFQNTGVVTQVNYRLGDYVNAGALIAGLSMANLSAALQQAEANLAVAQANLDALTVGTRPEQLAIDQRAVTQDQIALRNAITSAYAVTDNAIHISADQFFTNPRGADVALTFIVTDAVLANTVTRERIVLESTLASWSAQIVDPVFSTNDPTSAATQAVQHLMQASTFLNNAAAVLTKASNLSAANTTTYQASIATARTNIAAALTTLTTAQTTLTSAVGALTLAEAGSTSQSIAAGQAEVAQAQAGVANARANLQNAQIIAPISGVITQQDAKIGQLASPGTPLVSIIGTGGFEVDTGVSDTDIGKLAIGNRVSMTLDAFPGETFTGSVFYIAPAETTTQDVVSYQVKISFDTPDPRLKSGLTVNVDIQTKQKSEVLILPQYAILQNDNGTFVERLMDDVATTSPVTLGIQDQKGNVEILSGVTLGEQVINIGLKQ